MKLFKKGFLAIIALFCMGVNYGMVPKSQAEMREIMARAAQQRRVPQQQQQESAPAAGEELQNKCAICLNPDDTSEMIALSCHPTHIFHTTCIAEWASENIANPTCPLCKKAIIQEDLKKIGVIQELSIRDLIDRKEIPAFEMGDYGLTLDLSHKKITSLEGLDEIEGIANIQVLSLSDNPLSSIPEKAFVGLANLKKLSLAHIKLRSIPEKAFVGLANLQDLNLADNQLNSIPEKAFDGLAKLQWLYLFSNQLNSIPENAFEGLVNLLRLNLSDNQLNSIPEKAFAGLVNLKELDLEKNQLNNIPEKAFAGLVNLKELYLEENQLNSIPENAFAGLTNLKTLYLDDNELTPAEEQRIQEEVRRVTGREKVVHF